MLLSQRKLIVCIIMAGVLVAGFALDCVAQEPTSPPVPASKRKLEDSEIRRVVKELTAENERLRARVSELEKSLQGQSVRDRLAQEEQRLVNIEDQLMVLGEKEGVLQSRLDAVNEQLRPENIDQLQVMGSMRPEEVREATRRRLTSEQKRLQAQLELLHQSRSRLQSSLSVADMLIQNLRLKMQTVSRP